MFKFVHQTAKERLTLGSDGSHVLTWSINAAFAVHDDYKSHTGGCLSMGRGALMPTSSKQKLNMRSSMEAEIMVMDDIIGQALWTTNFLEAQGYEVRDTVLLQDNQSYIRPETNG